MNGLRAEALILKFPYNSFGFPDATIIAYPRARPRFLSDVGASSGPETAHRGASPTLSCTSHAAFKNTIASRKKSHVKKLTGTRFEREQSANNTHTSVGHLHECLTALR
jgi:hypothetical protein